MMIDDKEARLRALDPKTSFIVQAPAGSGKTELLIQRFLVLLGTVTQPEEIIGITFTKKSAAEMRARIMHALHQALQKKKPESLHAQKTLELAEKVLQQNESLQWNLLESPHRLRLQTIDSFNAYLTRQLPILSRFGANPDITDDATPLYRQAAQEFLSHLEENHPWSDAIATIIFHMDNDLTKVEMLLVNLLAKRDQWLRYIILNSHDPVLRKTLEKSLESIVTDALQNLDLHLPKKYRDELLYLLKFSSKNLRENNKESPIASCLYLRNIPEPTLNHSKYWLAIAELLLTKSNQWRKRFDKDIGFLPADFYKNSNEKKLAQDAKQRIFSLIENLKNEKNLLSAFEELRLAPAFTYQESQWKILDALHTALKVVTAELHVVFQQQGKIDYIENALAADTALGTDESPTDLNLLLDYQIKHILVDEFQDTSNNQYQLLKKLSAGWEVGDGRTFFLVGDPMQSIYRFREAEVGIFIRTRQHGIGNIPLQSLTLTTNFRSTPAILDWINEHFHHIFPSFDDIATGAVSYSRSKAHDTELTEHSHVTLHAFKNAEEETEAKAITKLIKQYKNQYPAEKIAILVRSRTHLRHIVLALKKAHIPYRAINIDPLIERPFIQDLIALTRALFHVADRVAWLAILRAPWCGLSLSDLFILSNSHTKKSLWEQLQTDSIFDELSSDGQERLQRILPILKAKMAERYRKNTRYWIESTWLLLGGPACLEEKSDLEDADAYFNLLEKYEKNSELLNLDTLYEHAGLLYAKAETHTDDTLHIMTIHNAKGLEFDTVILPSLQRKASHDEKQLLLWMDQPRQDGKSALIIAPIQGVGKNSDPIYDYIKRQHAIKNNYEKNRLLYVAATRAKKRLDLFFNIKDKETVNTHSLLEELWPLVKNKISYQESFPHETHDKTYVRHIKRFPLPWKNPIQERNLTEDMAYHQKNPGFQLKDPLPKYRGILIHQILQQMSYFGISWWQEKDFSVTSSYLKKHLLQLGMPHTDLNTEIEFIHQAIKNILNDERGKWILFPHQEAEAEYRLTATIQGKSRQLIMDRTFVNDNIRWIIDYKTSIFNRENLSEFLLEEQKKYQQQMFYYFEAMRSKDKRPIRMGLYFPLIPAWQEWTFEV